MWSPERWHRPISLRAGHRLDEDAALGCFMIVPVRPVVELRVGVARRHDQRWIFLGQTGPWASWSDVGGYDPPKSTAQPATPSGPSSRPISISPRWNWATAAGPTERHVITSTACAARSYDPTPPRHRIKEIRDNLHARIEDARHEGWLGVVDGLQISLDGARQKFDQLAAQRDTVNLGMPNYSNITTPTSPGALPKPLQINCSENKRGFGFHPLGGVVREYRRKSSDAAAPGATPGRREARVRGEVSRRRASRW